MPQRKAAAPGRPRPCADDCIGAAARRPGRACPPENSVAFSLVPSDAVRSTVRSAAEAVRTTSKEKEKDARVEIRQRAMRPPQMNDGREDTRAGSPESAYQWLVAQFGDELPTACDGLMHREGFSTTMLRSSLATTW